MKKIDREFLNYQKLCYEKLDALLDAGWNDFKFNQPPEFILGLTFINSILTHPNLCLEGKQEWLKAYKRIFSEMPDDLEEAVEKMTPKKSVKINEEVKKSILH
tara:strand:+ start:138 stop:446 length:309 start_codon:yes stop_codon:yes gene_type:complete